MPTRLRATSSTTSSTTSNLPAPALRARPKKTVTIGNSPDASSSTAVSIDYADGSPAVRLEADGSGRVFYRGGLRPDGAPRRGVVAAFVDVHAASGSSAAFFFDEPNADLAPPNGVAKSVSQPVLKAYLWFGARTAHLIHTRFTPGSHLIYT